MDGRCATEPTTCFGVHVDTMACGRRVCGMHGHDNLMQFEHDRMFLKCISCGHESPGWAAQRRAVAVGRIGDASVAGSRLVARRRSRRRRTSRRGCVEFRQIRQTVAS